MWTCLGCKIGLFFSVVEIDLDADGWHFLCPFCAHRNQLVNIGKDGYCDLTQPAFVRSSSPV